MAHIRVGWNDRNWIEQGHHIYRSLTPMDVVNMPTPIATVGKNVTFYDDYDVIEGTEYYYRIGAYINNDVAVSNEFTLIAVEGLFTDVHDAFNDGSIIATYPFDNNADDMAFVHNLSWAGTVAKITNYIHRYITSNITHLSNFTTKIHYTLIKR